MSVVEVASVSLHGNPPPYEFRIPFPEQSEIAAPGNALKLEAIYSFKGDKQNLLAQTTYSNTQRVIDSIYVSNSK